MSRWILRVLLTVLGCVDGRGFCGFLVLVLVLVLNSLLDSAADERLLEFGHHHSVQGG